MKPTKQHQVQHSLFGIGSYLIYFLASALVVTVIVLIVYKPTRLDTVSLLRPRAIVAMVAILAFALIMTLSNGLWRRYTIGRPVKRILDATQRLTDGDFSVRIETKPGITELDELDAIIDNFNIMATELGSVEALQSDFIASVSHELKTPLAVIQNYATILQDPGLSPEDRQNYAMRITSATSRLSVLITNIMKMNKLDNQQITPKTDNFLLNEQLAEVLVNYESLWEAKNLDLDAEMADLHITSDKALLELAWNNLITNAIKFTRNGGHLKVTMTQPTTDLVEVAISDDGVGMTDDVRHHIFDKFYQADTARASQGNGLGLALVKRVVDLLQGSITVTSTPDKGSTFRVTLPVTYSREATSHPNGAKRPLLRAKPHAK